VTTFDVESLRARFPALSVLHDGRPMAFFDGPGGTQVPDTVIEAVTRYYRETNANHGGAFETSARSDAIVDEAHRAMVDLFGAASPDEITFGANMTTLTLHVSRSISATMQPGDEIVVTGLDHEANVGPWRSAAGDRGLRVRTLDVDLADCTLDLADLDRVLGPRTRLLAVGWASNAVGTINPIAVLAQRAHDVGALVYVDAVHFAPHVAMDVAAAGADFVVCSTYKFFGPHAGVLYGRRDVLDRLPSYKIRPARLRFETGTANFEGIAGALAAVEYLADVGRSHGDAGASATHPTHPTRRDAIVAAMHAIRRYEMALYERLASGLEAIDGVRLYGITDHSRFDDRTPTAALTIDGVSPHAAAHALGRQGIAVWDGDFYATGVVERLGLADSGGLLRIGLTHYNTSTELDRLLEALGDIARHAPASTAISA
jgi:cysteine desulfurase family protein (TIGR01976 family)